MTSRIYVLKHPDTQEIVYVGVTTKELKSRLIGHLADQKISDKTAWIKNLKMEGKVPVIEEIETVEGYGFHREKFWIDYYTTQGVNLFNQKVGGFRANAGAKLKYGEELISITVRVPVSKIPEYKAEVKEILRDWEVKKKK